MSGWNWFGIFAGIGAALVILACTRAWRALRTRRWHEAEGVMTAASWQLQTSGEDSVVHVLLVGYSYSVNATRYTASRVSLEARSYGTKKAADAAVARYAPGTRVRVFHDPSRPERAVLEREPIGVGTLVIALIGVAIFVAAAILFPAGPSSP